MHLLYTPPTGAKIISDQGFLPSIIPKQNNKNNLILDLRMMMLACYAILKLQRPLLVLKWTVEYYREESVPKKSFFILIQSTRHYKWLLQLRGIVILRWRYFYGFLGSRGED